ncbi:CinA family protein [Granulicoccus phenolivorans]|uniref:CinA family protein n=1 Tax=Granulicoccus phenolivorans TaxID=266854 RepID=UPI0003F6BCF3|nr:CinA family protein [Granulicoccus phenolivorans]
MTAPVEVGTLGADLIAAATARGRTIATAESLTGGLLGATITAVPGASLVYRGGLITYATDLKHTLGGVPAATLDTAGAVSAPTVEALARHTAQVCGATIGLSLSGVAGPDPQEGYPAGTVWLGWSDAAGAGSELLTLSGDRAAIRAAAVTAALHRAYALVTAPGPGGRE